MMKVTYNSNGETKTLYTDECWSTESEDMQYFVPEGAEIVSIKELTWGYCANESQDINDWNHFLGIQDAPKELCAVVHAHAWGRGHASGYSEVFNYYSDMVDIIEVAIKLGAKS